MNMQKKYDVKKLKVEKRGVLPDSNDQSNDNLVFFDLTSYLTSLIKSCNLLHAVALTDFILDYLKADIIRKQPSSFTVDKINDGIEAIFRSQATLFQNISNETLTQFEIMSFYLTYLVSDVLYQLVVNKAQFNIFNYMTRKSVAVLQVIQIMLSVIYEFKQNKSLAMLSNIDKAAKIPQVHKRHLNDFDFKKDFMKYVITKLDANEFDHLLCKNTGNINLQDEDGNTWLHYVVVEPSNSNELMDVAFRFRIDPKTKNKAGKTCLNIIVEHDAISSFRDFSVFEKLLKYCDLLNMDFAEFNDDGYALVHLAVIPIGELIGAFGKVYKRISLIKSVIKSIPTIDIKLKSRNGASPLYYAIKHEMFSDAEMLIAKGADASFNSPEKDPLKRLRLCITYYEDKLYNLQTPLNDGCSIESTIEQLKTIEKKLTENTQSLQINSNVTTIDEIEFRIDSDLSAVHHVTTNHLTESLRQRLLFTLFKAIDLAIQNELYYFLEGGLLDDIERLLIDSDFERYKKLFYSWLQVDSGKVIAVCETIIKILDQEVFTWLHFKLTCQSNDFLYRVKSLYTMHHIRYDENLSFHFDAAFYDKCIKEIKSKHLPSLQQLLIESPREWDGKYLYNEAFLSWLITEFNLDVNIEINGFMPIEHWIKSCYASFVSLLLGFKAETSTRLNDEGGSIWFDSLLIAGKFLYLRDPQNLSTRIEIAALLIKNATPISTSQIKKIIKIKKELDRCFKDNYLNKEMNLYLKNKTLNNIDSIAKAGCRSLDISTLLPPISRAVSMSLFAYSDSGFHVTKSISYSNC